MSMQYIGANGVSVNGGSDFGSGLGVIPSSSLHTLGGMGNEISGAGMLGSFGNMKQFSMVGVGQSENPAQAAQVAVDPQTVSEAQMIAQKIVEQEKRKEGNGMMKKALIYGAVGFGAFFLYKKFYK